MRFPLPGRWVGLNLLEWKQGEVRELVMVGLQPRAQNSTFYTLAAQSLGKGPCLSPFGLL